MKRRFPGGAFLYASAGAAALTADEVAGKLLGDPPGSGAT